MVCWIHGKTKKDRFGFGGSGSTGGGEGKRCSPIAHGSSRSFACVGPNDLEGDGQGAWSWACDGGSAAGQVPATEGRGQTARAAVGRATAGAHEAGGRGCLSGRMEAQGRAGPVGGGDAHARRLGTRVGSPGKALGGVPLVGATPLAQSGPGHAASQGPAVGPRRVEKKRCPKSWRPC